MFFYQALIMGVIVSIIFILTYLIKLKNRTVLVFSIIILIGLGGIGMYAVQYYFGNHFYQQNINTSQLSNLESERFQRSTAQAVFSDYHDTSNIQPADTIEKVYKINANGAQSRIVSEIYFFSDKTDANNYYEFSQKFYANKNYIPLDPIKCQNKDIGVKYLVSFIKSEYKDVNDFIYLPSKISYTSDLIIQDDNIIVTLTETSNKPVTNKNTVVKDIIHRISLIKGKKT